MEPGERRRLGDVFDGVARDYDRERPTYPDAIVDAAVVGLPPGARVLEVGCGTGKLTAALVARGLAVHALDPGPHMLELAREAVGGRATFALGRFEDADLPRFAALFSATAFHWVDPSVGWAKAADVLEPGGRLVLLQFCGLRSDGDEALTRALARAAPGVDEPPARTLDELLRGVEERRGNVSEVWSYLSRHELSVPETRFTDVELTTAPVTREWTADQLNAYFRTTSFFVRLGPERSAALEAENRRAIDGTIRLTELAVLVTARRAAAP